MFLDEDKLHEECGVVGVYTDNNDVTSRLIYYGLFALAGAGKCGDCHSYGGKNQVSQGHGFGG